MRTSKQNAPGLKNNRKVGRLATGKPSVDSRVVPRKANTQAKKHRATGYVKK